MAELSARAATSRTPPRAIRGRDAAVLFLVAFLAALCYPLITVGLKFAPPFSFAALRALIAGSTLALAAWFFRRPVPRSLRTWIALAVVGLGTTSLGFLGMFHASEYVSPGLATVITNGQPLLAAILAHVFLHERLSWLQRLGLGLGFVGIVVISLPQFGGPAQAGFVAGVAYIAVAASGVAVGNVVMKALGSEVDPLMAMAAQTLFGALPLSVAAIALEGRKAIVWSPEFLVSLLALALLGTALAYWLWFTLLRRVPLSRANAFTFLTPVMGFGFGMVFFGEHLGIATLIGLLFAVAGILLVEATAPYAPRQAPLPVSEAERQ
ncbi:MAG: EamA family transporter [Rhodobacteraceae bacterium]|nr:EamA family transporter [Paracoccaceae bacterium]